MINSEVLTKAGFQITANSPLIERLGSSIWPARSAQKPGKDLVIKAIPLEANKYLPEPPTREDVQFEGVIAQLLAQNSDHVTPVIAVLFDELANSVFLVMENLYSQGFEILSVYAKENDLSFNDIIIIFDQVASVVAAATKNGILHQDIKPENIWIKKNKAGVIQVKLGDFGIARPINLVQEDVMNEENRKIPGTIAYVSFEKYWPEPHTIIDVRADIFSMGSSIYNLLFDRPYHDLDQVKPTDVVQAITQVGTFYHENLITNPKFITQEDYARLAQQGVDTLELLRFFIKTIGPVGNRFKTPEAFMTGLRNCQPNFEAETQEQLEQLRKIDRIRKMIKAFSKKK